jgi:cell volume regulation protein A
VRLDLELLDSALLAGAVITLVAVLAVRVSARAGLPSLLIYLAMGVALSQLGVHFNDVEAAHAIGFAALVVILAEGGISTKWDELRPAAPLGAMLATVGIAVSVTVVATAAHYLLGMDWQLAVLLGAVVSPTDSAAVFSVLRYVPVPRRLTAVLEAESGLNDAPTVLLVSLVSTGAALDHGVLGFLGIVIAELVGGVAFGALVGLLGARLMRRAALPSSGLYPLAVLALAVLAYAGGAALHLSGFAAVYTAAVILGNSELPHRSVTRSFTQGAAWLAQIGLFIMLGQLAVLDRISVRDVVDALVIGLVLTLVARPLSILACIATDRMRWPEAAFISWAGLRGAVPIVLATIPLAADVGESTRLFDITFVFVVIFTLLTGPALPWIARLLGVLLPEQPRDVDIEAAPLDRVAADLLIVTVTKRSRLHGVEVGELRLPAGASVSLIVREGHMQVPVFGSVLQRGDDLLVVTPRKSREQTEERLRAVSRNGRLAQWLSRG